MEQRKHLTAIPNKKYKYRVLNLLINEFLTWRAQLSSPQQHKCGWSSQPPKWHRRQCIIYTYTLIIKVNPVQSALSNCFFYAVVDYLGLWS